MTARESLEVGAAPHSGYRLREAFPTLTWMHDAGWRDTWYVISYPLRTWRCRLFGHKWGPECADYDSNIGAHMESWRDCERDGCEGWWQTYHYLAGGKQRVLG